MIEQALAYAERRAAEADRELVIVHGDPHPDNLLAVTSPRPGAESGYVFVDPDGFVADRAYDLGVAMRNWSRLLGGADARPIAEGLCAVLAERSGVDATRIWEWAFLERVSTGLYLLDVVESAEAMWRSYPGVGGEARRLKGPPPMRQTRSVLPRLPRPGRCRPGDGLARGRLLVRRPRPGPDRSAPPSRARPRNRAPTRHRPRPVLRRPRPPATYQMPLALVVHPTRTTADVDVAAARRVVARGATRWSAIDQPGGRMRVVSFEDRSAREVLREVRASRNVLGIVPADAVDARVRVLTVGGRHPLRDPKAYPLEVESDRPVPKVTTMTVVGDIMVARRVGQAIADDPRRPFRPLAKRLAGADITVGNLESTLSTDGSPTQGGDSFGARPRVLRGLDFAGFDLVSLANNHVGDYGDRAMRQTFARLRAADLDYVGAGRTLAEARRPVVITRDGVRIGFLGTESIGETPAAGRTRAGTNRLNMPPRTGPLDRDRAAPDRRRHPPAEANRWTSSW